MWECLNCGEPPDTCVCIDWCYKHDCEDDPCHACVDEFKTAQTTRREQYPSKPWFVKLWWQFWYGVGDVEREEIDS